MPRRNRNLQHYAKHDIATKRPVEQAAIDGRDWVITATVSDVPIKTAGRWVAKVLIRDAEMLNVPQTGKHERSRGNDSVRTR